MFIFPNFPGRAPEDNLDALAAVYESALVCADRLISLNIKATQVVLEGNLAEARALMTLRDMPGVVEAQSDTAQRRIQQAVDYAVSFNEVIAENQKELGELLKNQAEGLAQAQGSSVASGPMLAVDMVKTMLDAATRSRDHMLDMAKQLDTSKKA